MRARVLLLLLLAACDCGDAAAPGQDELAGTGSALLGVGGVGLVVVDPDGTTRQVGPRIGTFYEMVPAGEGRVWISTLTKLYRYDPPDTLTGIDADGVPIHIDVGPEGQVFASFFEGVRTWDGTAWQDVDLGAIPQDEQRDIKRVVVLGDELWLFTFAHVWRRQGSQWSTHDPPDLDELRFRHLVRTADGVLIASDDGLHRLDANRTWARLDYPDDRSVPTRMAVHGDRLFASRPRGRIEQFTLSRASLQPESDLQVEGIEFIADTLAVDEGGRLWQSTRDTLVVHGEAGTVIRTAEFDPLLAGFVRHLWVDRGGPRLD